MLLNALYFALIHSAGINLEIFREDKSPILERKRTHGFDQHFPLPTLEQYMQPSKKGE